MTQAEESGTPQLAKLGIERGKRVRLLGADPGWTFAEPLVGVDVVDHGPCDIALVFVRAPVELDAIQRWAELVFPSGACWVAWSSTESGDVDENTIREAAHKVGLVDVEVATIDTAWSGLKVEWHKENRTTGRIPKKAIQEALGDSR